MNKSIVDQAVSFACCAHAGAVRKSTDIPYIVHPIEVMKIVCDLTKDKEVRAAAVLHDTVEDTPVTRADLEALFGSRVAELVASESENKREGTPEEETWCIRKTETLNHLEKASRDIKIICLGDKLANMRDMKRDFKEKKDNLWERFNAPDNGKGLPGKAANLGWYYRGVATRLESELGNTAAWEELDRLVREVFDV